MICRHCHSLINNKFLDLGFSPPSNAYLTSNDLSKPETYFPLVIFVCDNCWLVQTKDYSTASDLFRSDYAYFSSTSLSWLSHAATYSSKIIEKFNLTSQSFVIEIASNDGYLLKNFVVAGVPCLGIEPTESTALAAEKIGIPVLREFFSEKLGLELAQMNRQADLIVANNVYAHVPDINDFTLGLKRILKKGGVITLEFPHLLKLIENVQFDTIYHEHFSYLSLYTVQCIFKDCQLRIFDVEYLPTHGGSLRVYGCHEDDVYCTSEMVDKVLKEELNAGLKNLDIYQAFQAKANVIKNTFIQFLLDQKKAGKTLAAYGAAAKANTLLNYAGIKSDLIPFICDAAPSKQQLFMPGSHIPIFSPDIIASNHIDYLIIFPWNISAEIKNQLKWLRKAGTRFVTFFPALNID